MHGHRGADMDLDFQHAFSQDLINLMGTLVQAFLNGILVWQSVSTARQAAGKEPPPDLAFKANTT